MTTAWIIIGVVILLLVAAAKLAVTAEERDMLFKERNDLQHKLSAHLCPRNDHVWGEDGKCKRCGADRS